MSKIQISELPTAEEVKDESYLPIDDGEMTYKIRVDDFNAKASASAKQYAEAAASSAESASAASTAAAKSASEISLKVSSVTEIASTVSTLAGQTELNAAAANSSASTAISSAAEAQTSATEAKSAADSIGNEVLLAESWAHGNTGVRAGENADNAMFWARQAQSAAGGGLVSFNGRTNPQAAPQSGDYTAQMVTYNDGTVADALGNVATQLSNTISSVNQALSDTESAVNQSLAQTTESINASVTQALSTTALQGNIAGVESTKEASKAYKIGDYLMLSQTLYRVTSAITQGDTLTPGTNINAIRVMDQMYNATKGTIFSVPQESWVLNSETSLYEQTLQLNHIYVPYVELDVSGSAAGVAVTDDEETAYNLLKRGAVYANDADNTLHLFATDAPGSDFYIIVKGVD